LPKKNELFPGKRAQVAEYRVIPGGKLLHLRPEPSSWSAGKQKVVFSTTMALLVM
jgi:hypothetical protein